MRQEGRSFVALLVLLVGAVSGAIAALAFTIVWYPPRTVGALHMGLYGVGALCTLFAHPIKGVAQGVSVASVFVLMAVALAFRCIVYALPLSTRTDALPNAHYAGTHDMNSITRIVLSQIPADGMGMTAETLDMWVSAAAGLFSMLLMLSIVGEKCWGGDEKVEPETYEEVESAREAAIRTEETEQARRAKGVLTLDERPRRRFTDDARRKVVVAMGALQGGLATAWMVWSMINHVGALPITLADSPTAMLSLLAGVWTFLPLEEPRLMPKDTEIERLSGVQNQKDKQLGITSANKLVRGNVGMLLTLPNDLARRSRIARQAFTKIPVYTTFALLLHVAALVIVGIAVGEDAAFAAENSVGYFGGNETTTAVNDWQTFTFATIGNTQWSWRAIAGDAVAFSNSTRVHRSFILVASIMGFLQALAAIAYYIDRFTRGKVERGWSKSINLEGAVAGWEVARGASTIGTEKIRINAFRSVSAYVAHFETIASRAGRVSMTDRYPKIDVAQEKQKTQRILQRGRLATTEAEEKPLLKSVPEGGLASV